MGVTRTCYRHATWNNMSRRMLLMVEFLMGLCWYTTRQLKQESTLTTDCRNLYYMYHFPEILFVQVTYISIVTPAINVPLC